MGLRNLRIKAGMTQQELADKLEVNQAAVSRWENGDNPPLPKYQKKICRLFGCTAEELLKEG